MLTLIIIATLLSLSHTKLYTAVTTPGFTVIIDKNQPKKPKFKRPNKMIAYDEHNPSDSDKEVAASHKEREELSKKYRDDELKKFDRQRRVILRNFSKENYIQCMHCFYYYHIPASNLKSLSLKERNQWHCFNLNWYNDKELSTLYNQRFNPDITKTCYDTKLTFVPENVTFVGDNLYVTCTHCPRQYQVPENANINIEDFASWTCSKKTWGRKTTDCNPPKA